MPKDEQTMVNIKNVPYFVHAHKQFQQSEATASDAFKQTFGLIKYFQMSLLLPLLNHKKTWSSISVGDGADLKLYWLPSCVGGGKKHWAFLGLDENLSFLNVSLENSLKRQDEILCLFLLTSMYHKIQEFNFCVTLRCLRTPT